MTTSQNLMFQAALRLISRVDDLRRLDFALGSDQAWEPPLDLIETDTEVLAYVAVPGVDISTVEIETENGTLVVRGERQRPAEWVSAGILRLGLRADQAGWSQPGSSWLRPWYRPSSFPTWHAPAKPE